MVVALVLTPTSGNIVSKKTAVNVQVTGAAANTSTGYNTSNYPASPEVRYYIKAALTGQNDLKSYQFAVDSSGTHTFYDLVFPAAGTWTVTVNKVSDDSVAATTSPVVS